MFQLDLQKIIVFLPALKRNRGSIEKVNAQLPDLNGGVVRLLLQMKKQDSPLIFVVRLLLQMMRLPLQNCIYFYK